MNENSLIKFLIGTAIGGAGVYYALKHQDEIMDKVVEVAKDKLDTLTENIQSKLEEFKGDTAENKNDRIDVIIEELNHLRKEVAKFKS